MPKSAARVSPAPRTRTHGAWSGTRSLAASTNHAKPRAPIPAAIPSATAPARSANDNGGAPCAGNSGVVSLTATNAR